MIKIIIYLLLSFFLDGLISTYISTSSIFLPLFSITSLVIIYRLFERKEKTFFIFFSIIGFLYDIFYTVTLIVYLFIFLLVALFIKIINIYLANNLLSYFTKLLLTIIFFRLITYLILLIVGYLNFNFMGLIESIYTSLIINFIYIFISYF